VSLLQDLAEIERRHGVVRASGRLYRFDHHQIQEILYDSIAPRLREEYHAMLADGVRANLKGKTIGDADAYRIAQHALRGSRPETAADVVRPAIDYLTSQVRVEETTTLAQAALAVPELLTGEDRVEVLLLLSKMRSRLGRAADVLEPIDEAIRISKDPKNRSNAHKMRAHHFGRSGEFDTGMADLDAMKAIADETGSSAVMARWAGAVCTMNFWRGDIAEALANARTQMEVSEAKEASPEHLMGWGRVGLMALLLGRFDEAREHHSRTLEESRRSSDPIHYAVMSGHMANLELRVGHLREALRHAGEHLTVAREVAYVQGEIFARSTLGQIWLALGRLDRAREELTAAVDAARSLNRPQLDGNLRMTLGRIEHAAKNVDRAGKLLTASVETLRGIDAPTQLAEALLALGEWTAARGDTELAIQHFEETAKFAETAPTRDVSLLARGHIAVLGGDVSVAELRAELREHEARMTATTRIEAWHLLWRAEGLEEDREAARKLLTDLEQHAPREHAKTMIQNVPLHRAIRS